jgi:integrase
MARTKTKKEEPKAKKYYRKMITLPNGTRKSLTAKTQEALDKKVMELQVLQFSGIDICSEETFGHFAQMWFDLYKKPYLKEKSLDSIKYVLNQHILPYLGDNKLRDITPLQIQSIMARLSKKSYSLQSKALIHLRSIFKVAEESRLILRSPVSCMLKAGGQKAQEKTALTPEESQHLLDAVKNPRARTFLLIALHTGMRRGEIVALRWDDIDFERGVIHITHNAVMRQYETVVREGLKTNAGKRGVPMSLELKDWLMDRKQCSRSKYVICMKDKTPLTVSSYKSMWKMIERELPGKNVTAHILRHTYITRLFEAGLDIKEIQYLAGHSSVDMTLRVYTHYDRVSREEDTYTKVREAFLREKEDLDRKRVRAEEQKTSKHPSAGRAEGARKQ